MKRKVVKILDVTDIERIYDEILYYRQENNYPDWDDIQVYIYSDGSYKVLHTHNSSYETPQSEIATSKSDKTDFS